MRSRHLRPPKQDRRWGVLVAVAFALLAMVVIGPSPLAQGAPATITETTTTVTGVPEPDGVAVPLDVSVFRTGGGGRRPAVVLAHGFGGDKTDGAALARTLARRGYLVITYTARGFGRSGGRIHLDSPTYEVADARRLVDFAAARPDVLLDGPDDPRIGFAGASYGGALSLEVAALDHRVDAIAPAFTWSDLTSALFPQYATTGTPGSPAGVQPVDGTGVFKRRWASLFFLGGAGRDAASGGTSSSQGLCGRFDPVICAGYNEAATTGTLSSGLRALLEESSPARYAGQIAAPTLLVQGENDTLFPLDQADTVARLIPSSTPVKVEWNTAGHDAGIAIDTLTGTLEDWFGRYLLRDGSPPDTRFEYTVAPTSLVGENVADPTLYRAASYPGRGSALRTRTLPLSGGPQSVLSPPGGSPAALTNLPGTGGALASAASVGGYQLAVVPGQSAIFTSAPLSGPLTLTGSGRVGLRVSSSASTATLFVSLWDLGPTSGGQPRSAVLPHLAVAPVRLDGLTPNRQVEVTVALPPAVHAVPVGHRLQLVVASTDAAYEVPNRPAVYAVALAGPQLVLPDVPGAAVGATTLKVPVPLVITVGALLLAAAAALFVLWLRSRATRPRPDLRDTPLVVTDLVKTYGDGFRAVDGVSFSVTPGRVVGLLGPNGAGKTTIMRMLVGLIRPDSGEIFVSGEPVHAGADVLGSVGAFIEGPGFLPHLTGMENLRAYWAVTGRPLADAHLDEALEIAGLGTAVDKKVRRYSQGMRQRLGIAQAMLGLPELLVLDEPTNGLDPPQIKAMRGVLHDYAASGRTVVVSSHLLAEVEQTCTDVIVMHRGRVVLTGSVGELTGSGDVTVIGLGRSEPGAAVAALRGLGVEVQSENHGVRVSGSVSRAALVGQLVRSGIEVESVDGHRQLEEVFLNLVGPEGSTVEDQPQAADV